MNSAVFSGMFGALTSEHRMNSIANNLANVNTTGYKRDLLTFKDTFQLYAHDQIFEAAATLRSEKLFPEPVHLARTRIGASNVDFTTGPLKGTGGPLDVAIHGEGFFKVGTPNGDFYTRNGHFRLTADGLLVTQQGYPVLSGGGEITIPQGIKNIVISEDGRIFGDNNEVGQLNLVTVDNLKNLEKYGENLFRAREGATVAEDVAPGAAIQGFLEAPNVEVVYEMVNMIEAQRQFEAYQKVMQAGDALDKEAINKVGRAGR